jgi:hypothetical protein
MAMMTEDEMGRALQDGSMTVDDVIRVVSGGDPEVQVFVYPEVPMVEGAETWEQVGESGSSSTLFHEMRTAGATEEQMEEVGEHIERLRIAGHTLDKVYEWTPEDTDDTADADVPDQTPAPQ